jgi:hypothetical protein
MFLDDDRFWKKWQIHAGNPYFAPIHNILYISHLRVWAHDFCSYFEAVQGKMFLRLTLEFLAVQASPLNPACDLPAEES